MKQINELTGIYSLSKTLRFELMPVGKTLENIQRKGLIAQDEMRAEEYKAIKEIIDEYHKKVISMCLGKLTLNIKDLEEYVSLADNPQRNEAAFDKAKETLRKQIVQAFKKEKSFAELFKKDLIQKHLPEFVADDADKKAMVERFQNFTTYFSGFHENRKNMYSDEAKSTAIAYRIVHENLPVFLDNMKSFGKIKESEVSQQFPHITNVFEEYLNVAQLDDMFQLDYFSDTMTQEQIAVYNSIIGGRTLEDGTKLQGINEFVNLYNQQHKETRLPLLKPLYKMILSDRVAVSWLPEEFSSDEQMKQALIETHKQLQEVLVGNDGNNLKNLLLHIDSYDMEHIFIANDLGLTDISQQIFGQYDVYSTAMKQTLRDNVRQTPKERREPELYEDRINKLFKSTKSYSIAKLNSFADADHSIQNYFKQLGAYDRNGEQRINLFAQIEIAYKAASDILQREHTNIGKSDTETTLVKNLLDAYKALQHFVKPLLGNGDEAEKDNEFYAKLREAWDALDAITPLYNKVRNWLTRKPYSTEKVKLNFENPILLSGWSDSEANSSVIFKEGDNLYYLAILDNKSRSLLREYPMPTDSNDEIGLMQYLQGGDMGKNVQNLMRINGKVQKKNGKKEKTGPFADQNIRLEELKMEHLPAEINRIRKGGTYSNPKSNPNFNRQDLAKFIEFYKPLVCEYYSSYEFTFKDSSEYNTFPDFTNHIDQQAYQLKFVPFSKSYLMKLVDEGKLYLFKIWNKDFSACSKGTPNMHTMYWKMLFDKRNLADVVYKLCGNAQVFFRKKSLDIADTTVHPANHSIANKNSLNDKKQSTFNYDIIKNRRYTVDKFQFHVPITINFKFKATKHDSVNEQVRDIIRNGGIKHIIGIDRGERHLLYLVLIDLKGNIVGKPLTLNKIVNEYKGNSHPTNYKDLLAERESNRTEARKSWKTIENIKDLKQGYLSQVVHVISKMMVENDAIVVLEDLNMGFMRSRQKIERSVYEQFEKMLIDKLNYLVDKQKAADEPGGVLHALQLTNKFKSFKEIGKQSGCLFYIPAWNTSKIDPVTGFVNLFDTRYTNVDKARQFFAKFESIRYNADKDWFEFAFDYKDFTNKAEGTRTQWTLCTHGTRIRTSRNPQKLNQWESEEVLLTEKFKEKFAEAGIDIHGNLKEAICALNDKKYLEPLMHLMKLLLQMRNSITNSDVDYLLSPVADENGHFYDSRNCGESLPCDADANGAYNIARKGLWAIRQIQNSQEGEQPNLAIKNKDWLNFAQQKPYLDD